LNQALKQSVTWLENFGSSLAPTAITTAATRWSFTSAASCCAWEPSVHCLTPPSATCSAGAPEQARLTCAVMPGTAIFSTKALGERWHQLPPWPLVVAVYWPAPSPETVLSPIATMVSGPVPGGPWRGWGCPFLLSEPKKTKKPASRATHARTKAPQYHLRRRIVVESTDQGSAGCA
jgi:hypothetical protein